MSETKGGEFWIDGDETHKVPGTLTYGSGMTCTLELSGQLKDWSRNAEMQTILGLVDGGMQCVTLRDCLECSASGFMGTPGATQKYICHQVFKGKLMFLGGEQIDAESLTVSMWPLQEWLSGSNLVEFDWSTTSREPRSANFLPDECITIPGCRSENLDFTVEIWRSAGLSSGWNRKGNWLKAEPLSWVRLIPAEQVPVESLTKLVFRLQQLLTVLVNVPAVVNSVSFISPLEVDPGRNWYKNVELFAEWRGGRGEDDAQIRIYDGVGIGESGSDIIREWFRVCDGYGPAVDWLLSHYFTPHIPVDLRFNAAFTSVERLLSQCLGPYRPGRPGGYGKGEARASVPSLIQFIERASLSETCYFKDMDCGERRDWADRVMKIRDNYTAHLDWGENTLEPDGEEFAQQSEVLTCLGVGFLMSQMKIPRAVITEVLDRRLRDRIIV